MHSYNTSLEGWLVLVVRRHITSLAELTAAEADELGPLVRNVSAALHQVSGCDKTYLAQFAEHPDHQHVHVHLIPRRADHPVDALGPKVFRFLGDNAGQHVTEARMNEIAGRLRQAIAGS